MKSLVLSMLVAFVGSAAQAMPAIGDYAKYAATSGGYSLVLEQEIVAHDAAKDMFTVQTTSHVAGQSQVTQKLTARADLLSDEQANLVLAYCAAHGGTLEAVSVGAQQVQTCKFVSAEGSTWVGNVPFALVKYSGVEHGTAVTLNLVEYRRGN